MFLHSVISPEACGKIAALLSYLYQALVKSIIALLWDLNCKLTVVVNYIADRDLIICVESAGVLPK